MATAALHDHEHIEKCRVLNAEGVAQLTQGLSALGLALKPSFGNFVLPMFVSEDKALGCLNFLESHGLIVRSVKEYGLGRGLRITVAERTVNQRVINVIGDFLQQSS